MSLTVRSPQPFDGDVRVDLRRCQRSVTEQFLNATKVGPGVETREWPPRGAARGEAGDAPGTRAAGSLAAPGGCSTWPAVSTCGRDDARRGARSRRPASAEDRPVRTAQAGEVRAAAAARRAGVERARSPAAPASQARRSTAQVHQGPQVEVQVPVVVGGQGRREQVAHVGAGGAHRVLRAVARDRGRCRAHRPGRPHRAHERRRARMAGVRTAHRSRCTGCGPGRAPRARTGRNARGARQWRSGRRWS